MSIVAFIIILFGLAKIFLLLSLNNQDKQDFVAKHINIDELKIILSLVLFDGLLEILLGLFVLLWI